MNWKGFGMPIEVSSRHFPGGTEERRETSVRMICVPSEIRTKRSYEFSCTRLTCVISAVIYLWRNYDERNFPTLFRSIVERTRPSGEARYGIWSFSTSENKTKKSPMKSSESPRVKTERTPKEKSDLYSIVFFLFKMNYESFPPKRSIVYYTSSSRFYQCICRESSHILPSKWITYYINASSHHSRWRYISKKKETPQC
jgi:hypothetical protein